MSFDLLFESGDGGAINGRKFAAHFKSRRHFEISSGQAIYQNEDTGVVFIFDPPEEGIVNFTLNLYRPHVFGLEAAIELQAFAEALDARVVDPQDDAGGEEPVAFDRERFLKSWNAANRFAYRAMVGENPPSHTWPAKRIREVWKWNYCLPDNENHTIDDYFVPSIFAADVRGQAWSIAIWPPECSVLLPQADALLVPLAQTGKASEELAVVPWAEIAPVIAPYATKKQNLAGYAVASEPWPEPIAAFLNIKRKPMGKIEGIPMDELLDEELIAAASAG